MWRETPLADLAEITSGGTPSRDVPQFWGGDIPWVTPTDISACSTNILRDTKERISAKGLLGSPAKLIPAGSILLTSRATVGEARIAAMPVCTNQGFKNLTPKQNADGRFLFYQVQRCRGLFERYAAGSTFPEINKRDVGRVSILHPVDTSQQKKIAAILTSLDTAIEKTEALIEKHQQIKAGLMHDLFTRGVGDDGEIRPRQADAPHLYKPSSLGLIPAEWEVKRFQDLAEYFNGNTFNAAAWTDSGHPIIRIQNLNGSSNFNYFTGRVEERWRVVAGDLLFAWAGQRGVSFGGRIWRGPEGVLNQHIFKVVPHSKVVSKTFLYQTFRFRQSAIEDAAHGFKDSFLHVTRAELGQVLATVPSLSEQAAIESHLAALEDKARNDHGSLLKLQALKLGLMQDLLTGKVPVKIANPEAVPA